VESRPVARFYGLEGLNTFLRGKDYMFKIFFSGHNNGGE